MDDKKLFNMFVDFFRDSLENGWIKDFFSWIFWSIGVSAILKASYQINTITFSIFTGLIVILWIGYGFAVYDKAEDFFIEKYKNGYVIQKFPPIISLIMPIIISLSIFMLVFTSTHQFIDFLIKISK